MNKLKIGVLMGGMSIEKEVSFNSGRTICDHLDSFEYEIIPLFHTITNKLYLLPWRFLHRGKISDFENRLDSEAQQISFDDLKNRIDFIFIAEHGRYAEDGTLQGFLEVLGIPYFGTKVFGSALGMDKIYQKDLLSKAGISVPKGFHLHPHELESFSEQDFLERIKKERLDLPLVIKPYKEGSSLGVSVIFKSHESIPALQFARDIHPGEQQAVLVEEKIEGMEFSCITLTDHATGKFITMPSTEVVHEQGTHLHDYAQKYMPGRSKKYTPARCSKQIQEAIQKTCIKTMEVLEFSNMSRVDGFVDKTGKVIIVDPNSFTGTAPSGFFFNQAAENGMNHTQVINHLIETELQMYGLHKKQNGKNDAIDKPKLRVAVLMGGDTAEREVSLDSGRNICYKLSPHKYETLPIFVDQKFELYPMTTKLLVHNATSEIEEGLDRSTKINWHDLPNICDFVFIGIHGGRGENGSVQGTLEFLSLPYNGSSIIASALAMDKYKTANHLREHGFDTPQSLLLDKEKWQSTKTKMLAIIEKTLHFPVIVKPHNDGCSYGVQKADNKKELEKSIKNAFTSSKTEVLIEEFVVGMELTVGVIGNEKPQALPPSQALSTGDILSIEEKFLPGAGENQTPAPLTKEATKLVQKTMEQVYKSVGCSGYARIDCFYQSAAISPTKKERVVTLEINSLPGMTPATCIFHQAAEIGIKPMDFVDLLISFGLQKHKKNIAETIAKKIPKDKVEAPHNRTLL